MADDFKEVTLTNMAEGSRGIYCKGGVHEVFGPGETKKVTLPIAEYNDLPEHFKEGKAKKVEDRTPKEIAVQAATDALADLQKRAAATPPDTDAQKAIPAAEKALADAKAMKD